MMDYDKIILDMLNRIVTLEEKVKKMENADGFRQKAAEFPSGSKKYRFLADYLQESGQERVKLTFDKMEEILGFRLPDSASVQRTFWANSVSHSFALSWLSVDYSVVEVNLSERYVVFEREEDLKQ